MTVTPRTMTATPHAAMTTPTLATALDHLRLEGAIFLRGEYTEAWAYESPTGEMMASLLRPGRERLLYFHIIASGRCWVAIEGGEPHWAERGDVVVLPYGHQHRMGGETDTVCVSVMDLLSPAAVDRAPGDPPRRRRRAHRRHLRVPRRGRPAVRSLRSARSRRSSWSVRPAPRRPGSSPASPTCSRPPKAATPTRRSSTRLPAIVLAEVLRLHVATAPAADRGWLAALRDPVLAPALAELHRAPERKWTVADLAAAANVSRSLLDERFREALGRSPIRYLTDWRLHVAKDLLATTDSWRRRSRPPRGLRLRGSVQPRLQASLRPRSRRTGAPTVRLTCADGVAKPPGRAARGLAGVVL